jgi:demethylmenaquinone methyltransferase/2-methoxy-6-polyprenyl-1,4-benzoquinol methylase
MRPEWHYYRTLGLFRELGLQDLTAKALVGSVHAPLSGYVRRALADLFEMRWGGAQSELSPEDWTEYRRLCEPESPDFLLSRPDYYAFFTYSLFQAKVAG